MRKSRVFVSVVLLVLCGLLLGTVTSAGGAINNGPAKRGPRGHRGPAGPAGPPGADAAPGYAYMFTNAAAVLTPGQAVPFAVDGVAPTGGITHTSPTTVTFTQAGVYDVRFILSKGSAATFAMSLNDVVVLGTSYNTTGDLLVGQGIVGAAAGDVLRIVSIGIVAVEVSQATLAITRAG